MLFTLYRLNNLYKIVSLTFVCFLFIGISEAFSQDTKIRGKITDKVSGESLPFVNVVYQGKKNIGTISDFNGDFFLETRNPSDSLIISYVGYKSQTIKVKKGQFQQMNILLESDDIKLNEVVVLPGENPAHRIINKIVERKEINNPDKLDAYSYEVYNKLEIDVNNIDDEFKKNKAFKHFQFIFDYIDTSAITGKNFLPMFISETISDYYFRKEPKSEKENIKANKISGVSNESVTQLMGQMYLKVNIYDNFINTFGKGFVSPIANFGKMYYRYYLIDSTFIGNQWCYQISFKPRRKQEPTFTGDFWVHDTTFAIKKVQVRIADDANINFIQDLVVNQEYERVGNDIWMLSKDKMFVDFNLSDKKVGFFGRKSTSFKNFKFNTQVDSKIFDEINSIVVDKEAIEKDDEFWRANRHDTLSTKEKSIYAMVDSIKEVPMFRTFVEVVTLFVTGYKKFKYVEFGPYFKLYSFNPVEGHRVRLGARTTYDLSKKFQLDGFLAYGSLDEKFKYGMGTRIIFNLAPYNVLRLFHKNDMEQLGVSENAIMHDNVLASVLARNPNYKLTRIEEYLSYYEKEWFTGFSNKLMLSHRSIFPSDSIVFSTFQSNDTLAHLRSAEVTFRTRFAYQEKFVLGKMNRISLGTKYPEVFVDFTAGLRNVIGSNYEYYKIRLNIFHNINTYPFGSFRYVLDAGQIFGSAPYPFLELHKGNETYAFDERAFNTMNYYEFVSDRYLSLFVEQHLEGFFLNRVPLFRKLKLREVVTAKGVIGDLSPDNRTLLNFPYTLTSLEQSKSGFPKPFMEAGVGVENIFKIIRVDAMWRLSYLDRPNISKFGIRAALQIRF